MPRDLIALPVPVIKIGEVNWGLVFGFINVFMLMLDIEKGKCRNAEKFKNAEIQKYTVEIKMEIRNRKMKS